FPPRPWPPPTNTRPHAQQSVVGKPTSRIWPAIGRRTHPRRTLLCLLDQLRRRAYPSAALGSNPPSRSSMGPGKNDPSRPETTYQNNNLRTFMQLVGQRGRAVLPIASVIPGWRVGLLW